MTERDYLLQRMLSVSAKLSDAATAEERRRIEQTLLFYAKELQRLDSEQCRTMYIQ